MHKALSIYVAVLKQYFPYCFSNKTYINPVELNKTRFQAKALFIAAAIYLKSSKNDSAKNVVFETDLWLRSTFAHNNLFSSIISDSDSELINLFNISLVSLTSSDLESVEISDLYEALLGIEAGNESNLEAVSNAKNYRNKLGSYYTPKELARGVTTKTIDSFFRLNYEIEELSTIRQGSKHQERRLTEILLDIPTISFVDFSSGPGNFLIEVIDYFALLFTNLSLDPEKRSELITTIVSNVYAYDVDCLALEVAKLILLTKVKDPNLYSSLGDNFVHANFLLQTEFPTSDLMKRSSFEEGYIYHENLSLHKHSLRDFDIILGNPPWEKIRFEEKRFYAQYSNSIALTHFKADRTLKIKERELDNPYLAEFSKLFRVEIEKAKRDLKASSFFALSSRGELNTYALFTEAAIKLKSKRGVVGLVLKSAVVTSQVNQALFKYLINSRLVLEIYDFINRKKIFKIDSRERFCYLLLGNSRAAEFHISMNLKEPEELYSYKNGIRLAYRDLLALNPSTGMLPNFSSEKEAHFILRVSNEFKCFRDAFKETKFGRLVHFTNHSEYIFKVSGPDRTAVYEGKFFNQFDGKYSGFNDVEESRRYGSKASSIPLDDSRKALPDYLPESRYFISNDKWQQLSKNYSSNYMLAWRSLTSATNTRTCIATVLPFIPASQSVQFLTTKENDLLYLAGLFNSIVFDFILKKKLSGIDLTQTILNQMPVPDLERASFILKFEGFTGSVKKYIDTIVYSLLKDDNRLTLLFRKLGLTNELALKQSRSNLIRRLDLLFIFLYNVTVEELELIIAFFPKQYSKEDLLWFSRRLDELNKTVSSTCCLIPTSCPV